MTTPPGPDSVSARRDPPGRIERVIGRYGDGADGAPGASDAAGPAAPDRRRVPAPGPRLVIVAGLHGNEPAGIVAARRVLGRLEAARPPIRGTVAAFSGNLAALEKRTRFVDCDLNRMWPAGGWADPAARPVGAGRRGASAAAERAAPAPLPVGTDDSGGAEHAERRDLLEHVEREIDGADGPVTLIDLHSTSAESTPFCIISDTLSNRRVAFALGVPVILGLEESIDGTIQEYFGARGCVTAAVEGGQHDDPTTADHLESALWITLVTVGLLRESDVDGLTAHRRRLSAASRGLPRVVEIAHRYALRDPRAFVMQPGYRSFSSVRRGDYIARDAGRAVHAPMDGVLVLPNTQGVGDDGFFIGRRVRRVWLRLSTLFRRLRVDRALPLLPGVHRHPDGDAVLVADRRVARWRVLEVFHLCGYRRDGEDRGPIVFRRRVEG